MRIAPASIYFYNESDAILFERISEVSAITHGHFRSVFSCFVFSKYLIELFKGSDKFLALKKIGLSVSRFAKENEFNPDEIKLFDRILSGSIQHAKVDSIHSSGYVLHTLEAAFWCFLTTKSYEEAVLKAVNLGGDTDTTGCVTGALAGAYYDENAIPLIWLVKLAREKDIIKLSDDFTDAIRSKAL